MKRIRRIFAGVLLCSCLLLSACTTAGFYTSSDGTFFRGENGKNVVGWMDFEGERYYFNENGKMLVGGIYEIEGERYLFDEEGRLSTGFKIEGLSVLYFTAEGPAAKGLTYAEGSLYYFREDSGAMVTGFLTLQGRLYFFEEDGKARLGFLTSDGLTYYFSDEGAALTGLHEIEGKTYFFDEGGIDVGVGLISTSDGIFYIDEEHMLFTGFYKESDAKYYFSGGRMVKNAFFEVEGETYRFGEDGVMLTGFQEILGSLYHFRSDGVMTKNAVVDGFQIDENGVAKKLESSPPPSAPPAAPKESAAIGKVTGVTKLDDAVKKVLDGICDLSMSDEKKLAAVFDWMVNQMRYKYLSVDLSNGYTEELVNSLAEYAVLNRRGACEHQAALTAVFIERLGFSSIVVKGDFLSDDRTEWVEHAWVIAEVGGEYYHFDPLYGRNHTNNPRSFFMKKDRDIEALHQWVREDYPVCD